MSTGVSTGKHTIGAEQSYQEFLGSLSFEERHGQISIEEFQRQVEQSSTEFNERIIPVFDINKTLGVFRHDGSKFYDGVLEKLIELSLNTEIILVSGDQDSLLKEQFIKPILDFLVSSDYSDKQKKLIAKNLILYAQTGANKVKISYNPSTKTFKDSTKPSESATIPEEQKNKIITKIIPRIKEKFKNHSIFAPGNEFGLPVITDAVLNSNDSANPFWIQGTGNLSPTVELSIFGLRQGQDSKEFRKKITESPKARSFVTEVLNYVRILLDSDEFSGIKVEIGGISTIDFRRRVKADTIFRHIANYNLKPHLIKNLCLVGIGDSMHENGNDRSMQRACSIAFDVSQNNQNQKNINGVLDILIKFTKKRA